MDNITFKSITKDLIWVVRDGNETPVAVIFKGWKGNWELVHSGRTQMTGRIGKVKREAVLFFCTCADCVKGRS